MQDEEEKPRDKYQRVTKPQMELWLANPVTINYLKCLQFEIEQVDDLLKGNALVDSTNNDLSMNNIHSAMGSKSGLDVACGFEAILHKFEMVEVKENDE